MIHTGIKILFGLCAVPPLPAVYQVTQRPRDFVLVRHRRSHRQFIVADNPLRLIPRVKRRRYHRGRARWNFQKAVIISP